MATATATEDTLRLTAKADIKADGKTPKVEILAYSGGPMTGIPGFPGVSYLDLAGQLDVSGEIPILADHQDRLGDIAGQGTARIERGTIRAAGILTPATPAGQQVIALSKTGVTLQASVGFAVARKEYVPAGQSATVNGRSVPGPLTIVREGKLREISLVPIGADPQTTVTIQAKQGNLNMPDTAEPTDSLLQEAREAAARDEDRITAIRAAFQRFPVESVEWQGKTIKTTTLKAKAIREGAEVRDVEFALMRASLKNGPQEALPLTHDVPGADRSEVLEAALALHAGGFNAEKAYRPEVLQAAQDLGVMHVLDVAKMVCASHGIHARNKDELLRAAWSTTELPTMLGNVANKSLQQGYAAFPSVARQVAKMLDAQNFHTHTGIRLTGDFVLTSGGQGSPTFQHAHPTESTFTYLLDTFSRIIKVSRKSIINDDLGGLGQIPLAMGRGAAQALEEDFWKLVLLNTGSFFGSGNSNYIDGATSALGLTGLGLAVQAMRKQADDRGHPLALQPQFLVVPPELEALADQLYASANVVVAGATDTEQPDGNPYKGKYKPLCVPHLSNSGYSGYSTTGWYLFGSPLDVAAFGIAFLNGASAPTIEQVDPGPDFLGIVWRAYHDWGCCQIDPKGAVMSKGTT